MYRLEAIEEPPDVVVSKRMKRLLKSGAFSGISPTESDWSITDDLNPFRQTSISLLSESPIEKEKSKEKEKSVHFTSLSVEKSVQTPIISEVDSPKDVAITQQSKQIPTNASPPPSLSPIPMPSFLSSPPAPWSTESYLAAACLILYLLLSLASPILPTYFADIYRGARPPIPTNPRGTQLFNKLLHQRGFDGRPRPVTSQTNYRPVVQPRSKLRSASGVPLVELNIVSPTDGALVHSNALHVELKGALLQMPWDTRSIDSGASQLARDRHASLRILLDELDFSFMGERFVVPYDYSIVMSGVLGNIKNGLHHIEVTVDLVDLQAASLGLLQDNSGGNTTVSTSAVFYYFRPSNLSLSTQEQPVAASVHDRFEGVVEAVSSAGIMSHTAASDSSNILPHETRAIRFLSPFSDSIIGRSFNISVAAMPVYLVPTEYFLVLHFDNQVHDVTHLTKEADSLGRFNLEIHGAAKGSHTITLSAIRYHRDSSVGSSDDELRTVVERGQLVGSDTLSVECR